MKRYISSLLLFLLSAYTLSSCTEAIKHGSASQPQINFLGVNYLAFPDNVLKIPVEAETTPSSTIHVSYRIESDLIEGTDYTITPKEITFSPQNNVDTLYLTRKSTNDNSRTMSIVLDQAPKGYELGLVNFVGVDFLGLSAYSISFNEDQAKLQRQNLYEVVVKNPQGRKVTLPTETMFDLVVDPTSTAIEGVHYEFIGGPEAKVQASKHTGFFGIKFLKKEKDANKLILRLVPKIGFTLGQIPKISIDIEGPVTMDGTWIYDSFSTKEYLLKDYGDYGFSFDETIIEGNSDDVLKITGNPDLYQVTPEFKSDMKHILTAPGSATFVKDTIVRIPEESYAKSLMSIYTIQNYNIRVSKKHSLRQNAKVGFRRYNKDGKEILEMSLIEVEPKGNDFLTFFHGFLNPRDPYDLLTYPYRYTFTLKE